MVDGASSGVFADCVAIECYCDTRHAEALGRKGQMTSGQIDTRAANAEPSRRVRRRLPRWSELRPLLKRRKLILNPVERRLAKTLTIDDLRSAARRRVPQPVFDYVDGAAETETSLARARDAFLDLEFRPRILRDVAEVDTTVDVLGMPSALPLVLAPTGFTRMMHHGGETAVARAAARAGIPYTLSTMGTTSIEDLRREEPHGRHWFQLYLWRDRSASEALIDRAKQVGIDTLVLTVDTPIGGARLRDVRNGFTIPPTLTLKTLANISRYPSWWLNLMTTEPLEFASLQSWNGTVEELVSKMFDPRVTFEDLRWLRDQWGGKLVVKGIQRVDDACRAVDYGADGIVLSNHGGRQLDRASTPLDLLPDVTKALGQRAEVFIDTGITSGADLVAARALGASAGMIGRGYLYGLMAGGERGVDRALQILYDEAARTLRLLGVNRIEDVDPDQVLLRRPGGSAAAKDTAGVKGRHPDSVGPSPTAQVRS
ncbi:alpha-hydroxy-acid oxidizing protein [Streptomyces sp. Inha503]|uniref:alpha-hydroxy acid oxidase n=1 Tax=Streptomyces sp. Inha503 TaxID=3383314 RepID=UPI00399FD411